MTPIAEERKSELQAAGYTIEDMGAVWGEEWAGQYRWLNNSLKGDTFGVQQYSEDAAWADASQFHSKYLAATQGE